VLPDIGRRKDLSGETETVVMQAIDRFTRDFLRNRTESPALTPVR
jgi:hypothetical protein